MTGPGDVIAGLVCLVIAIVVGVLALPRVARCPAGYWVNGIRPSGAYQCIKVEGVQEWPAIDSKPEDVIEGQIACTGGALPIVVDHRTVGCQRTNQ